MRYTTTAKTRVATPCARSPTIVVYIVCTHIGVTVDDRRRHIFVKRWHGKDGVLDKDLQGVKGSHANASAQKHSSAHMNPYKRTHNIKTATTHLYTLLFFSQMKWEKITYIHKNTFPHTTRTFIQRGEMHACTCVLTVILV